MKASLIFRGSIDKYGFKTGEAYTVGYFIDKESGRVTMNDPQGNHIVYRTFMNFYDDWTVLFVID